jgi:hypothetical protein
LVSYPDARRGTPRPRPMLSAPLALVLVWANGTAIVRQVYEAVKMQFNLVSSQFYSALLTFKLSRPSLWNVSRKPRTKSSDRFFQLCKSSTLFCFN